MIEKQIPTRSEWKKHLHTHPLKAHGIWARMKEYVPGWGYSQAEIDAFFEGETGGGKKQVHWGSLTNKPGTFTPSAHAAAHHVGGGDLVSHDSLTGFAAAEHKFLPNTIAQVLSDHNVAAHNALDITELGTVLSGVWQGSAIANAYIAGINQNLLTSSNPTFADLTLTGDLNIADDKHVYLGATVQIRANGTNLFIRNFHAGEDRNIYLQASDGGILRDVLKFLGSENYTRIYNPRNQSAVALALITRKLDDFGTPDDNTDLNASTTRHGLLKKLGGGTENFLRADGAWAAPTPGAHAGQHEIGGGDLLAFADITGFSTWIDQAVKQASSPAFVGLTLTDDLHIADAKHAYFGSTGEVRQTGTNLFIRNFHAGEDRNIYLIASDGGAERNVLKFLGSENYTRIYDPRDASGNALALASALHAQSHTLASHSTKPHSALTDITSDQHHAQLHETAHRSGGGDALNHDLLAGFLAAEHKSLPNTIAQVLSDHNKAAHDALSLSHDSLSDVSIDDHHAQVHNMASHSDEHTYSILTTGTFGSGKAQVTKTAVGAGANDYHLELYSADTADSAKEISLRFHQAGRYYYQIRARSGGFRITAGATDVLDTLKLATLYVGETFYLNTLVAHNKVSDSDKVDGEHASAIVTKARVDAVGLTTVGTIGTGIWQGTAIANAYVAGINQNLLTTSSPTFASLTLTDNLFIADAKHIYLGSEGELRQTGANLFIRNFHAGEDRNIYIVASDGGVERHVLKFLGSENYTRIYDPRDAAGNALALASALHAQNHAASHHVAGGDLVNHDSLTGFVANEHINHGSVSMIAGSGLSGGGTIAASRTFNLGLLTAAWDAGAHQIRALKFYSDQATGTAPFTVLSTTKVTNLNADRLDNYHASSAAGNNTIVLRTGSGYIYCNYLNCTSGATAANPTHYFVETGNDSFLRQMTPANFVAALQADGLGGGGLTTYFRAYRAGAQAFADGVDTRVLWDTEKYDIGTNFAGSIFTAPANGYYCFHACITLSSLLAGTSVYMRLRKAGPTVLAQKRITGPAGFQSVEVSAQLYLTSGTWVEVTIYHTRGANLNISAGDTNSWFEGHRLDA